MRRTRPLTALLAILGLLSVALLGAGCGDSDDNGTTTSASEQKTATPGINVAKDPTIAAAVPESISSKGTLTVAADATYPPDEFIAPDGKTVIGMDADLAKAIGQVMGLKVDVQNITFDSIIPGLAANKYDLGMSSFTDTKEREQTVDFVTYLTA
jgi:polar amino acid transport system substrate-binding protein